MYYLPGGRTRKEVIMSESDKAVGPKTEQQVAQSDMSSCVQGYVQGIPTMYRTVLVLSESEGLKNQEIAYVLDCSLDTVKIRLHRARSMLRETLGRLVTSLAMSGTYSSVSARLSAMAPVIDHLKRNPEEENAGEGQRLRMVPEVFLCRCETR